MFRWPPSTFLKTTILYPHRGGHHHEIRPTADFNVTVQLIIVLLAPLAMNYFVKDFARHYYNMQTLAVNDFVQDFDKDYYIVQTFTLFHAALHAMDDAGTSSRGS